MEAYVVVVGAVLKIDIKGDKANLMRLLRGVKDYRLSMIKNAADLIRVEDTLLSDDKCGPWEAYCTASCIRDVKPGHWSPGENPFTIPGAGFENG